MHGTLVQSITDTRR